MLLSFNSSWQHYCSLIIVFFIQIPLYFIRFFCSFTTSTVSRFSKDFSDLDSVSVISSTIASSLAPLLDILFGFSTPFEFFSCFLFTRGYYRVNHRCGLHHHASKPAHTPPPTIRRAFQTLLICKLTLITNYFYQFFMSIA